LRGEKAVSVLVRLFFGTLFRLSYSRRDLLLENLALRQQLAVFKLKKPAAEIDHVRQVLLAPGATALDRVDKCTDLGHT